MKKPARQRRRPEEVRTLILEAASKVFHEKGLAGATADEIAVEAGVSRSALYRHFANKTEIFGYAVLQPFLEFIRNYSAAWKSQRREPWDDERLMQTMVGLFYDSFSTHRETLLAIVAAADELEANSSAQLDHELSRFFLEMLKISQKEVERRAWMSPDGLDLSIRLTLGSIAGVTVLSSLFMPRGGRKPSRQDIVQHLSSLCLYGLRLRPPQLAKLS